MDTKKEHNLIQSFVLGKWLVSTGYRESSAAANSPPWYYETIIWKWDKKLRQTGDMVGMADGKYTKKSALRQHFGACTRLSKGESWQKE
jgi:hypothetical protein